MKKQKLKTFIKLGILLFGISIILTNCQKNDDFDNPNLSTSNPVPVVKTIDFSEFLNQKMSKLTIEKLNKLNKASLKTSSNSNKDSDEKPQTITIDSTSIRQIIKDGTISYTFKIVQDNLNDTFFENLIIQTDSLQETSAYIIKYIPETDYDINNPFQGVREVTPIDSNININTSNSKTTVCVTVVTYINHYLCDQGVEQTPENCDYQYTEEVYDTTCTSTGGGDGITGTYTIPSGTSSDGGGGSSSGDSTDPNYDPTDPDIHGGGSTGPVLTSPIVDETENPCTSGLNNLVNKPIANQTTPKTVIDNLNYLKNNLNQNKEMMYFMSPTTAAETEFVENYEEGLPNTDEIQINLDSTAVSILMHSHYSTAKHLSVFSLSDIYQIYASINSGNIFSPSTFTSIVVTAHGTTYAIKISDTQAFLNWGNTFFTRWDLPLPPGTNPFINAREDDYEAYVKNTQTNNQNEHGIASFFSNSNLGLDLYKADSSFSTWSKITPNTNGTTTSTPCQ